MTYQVEKSGFTEDLEVIVVELNKLSEKKGGLEEQKRLWESSIERLKSIEDELENRNDSISSEDDLIQKGLRYLTSIFRISQINYTENIIC